MRSIRRWLLLYMLSLFAVAVGIAAFLIDRSAGNFLETRRQSEAELIDLRFAESSDEEQKRFDVELERLARRTADEVQAQYASRRRKDLDEFTHLMMFAPMASIVSSTSPNPAVPAMWFAVSPYGKHIPVVGQAYFSKRHLDDLIVTTEVPDEYIQVTVPGVGTFPSRNLHSENWRVDQTRNENISQLTPIYDDVKLSDGTLTRRVLLRWPVGVSLRFMGVRILNNLMVPAPSATSRPRIGPAASTAQNWYITIQCARPIASLHKSLAELHEKHVRDHQLLKANVAEDRFELRLQLATIGGLSLAGLLAGGLWIVREGLKPIDQLSEAVSQVNERDFHLAIDPLALSTELLPIHHRLTATLNALREAFEREKQAVADISHELRTPVAALLATLDVSLRKPRTPEEYRQTISECRAITKQLGQLVERVMTLAYLDAGQTRYQKTDVDAADLLLGCVAVIRPLAEAQGLKLELQLPDDAIVLNTDREKLRESLMNLLHNAVEYTNPGGTILLQMLPIGPQSVRFTVQDNGIGMSEDVQARIFERFFRADPSRTDTGVHAGLGLAIVKEYIERLGGTICVKSRPMMGSTFAIELPCSPA
ncbi:MAG: sensor histidine kinase [Gemmataceae bacterium]